MLPCPGFPTRFFEHLPAKGNDDPGLFSDRYEVVRSNKTTRWMLPPDESLEATLKRADDALYRAKEAGRNQVAVG